MLTERNENRWRRRAWGVYAGEYPAPLVPRTMPAMPRSKTAKTPAGLADALGHSTADKRIDILRGIGRSGSISQAAREAGVSYKAAWQAVATLTNLAGVPLVERVVGGAGGGGAKLTAQGEELLTLAEAYDEARRAVAVQAHPGGVAATGAGSAVAGLRIRTSMRNQLPGVVRALHSRGRRVRVELLLGDDEGSGAVLSAAITQESAELLGLSVGLPAIALCKATAVRIVPADETDVLGDAIAVNALMGVVSRVARTKAAGEGDELAVTLTGCGLELVGFAPEGVSLRSRQRVRALIDASAVVIALPG